MDDNKINKNTADVIMQSDDVVVAIVVKSFHFMTKMKINV